jgi:hypothetical protein
MIYAYQQLDHLSSRKIPPSTIGRFINPVLWVPDHRLRRKEFVLDTSSSLLLSSAGEPKSEGKKRGIPYAGVSDCP